MVEQDFGEEFGALIDESRRRFFSIFSRINFGTQ
jgi:hypothetical protein